MKKCVITLKDEVYCTVGGLEQSELQYFWNKFAIFAEGYRWMPAFKLGRWDGKIRFFEKTGKTYLRLLDEIVPDLVSMGYDISVDDKRVKHTSPTKRATIEQFSHIEGYGGLPMMMREYQVDAVNSAVDEGEGIILAATGAGKTSMCASLCDIYGTNNQRVIIIVPSADLVEQTYEALDMLEINVGRYCGDTKELDRFHVVATWQSLQNNPEVMKFFQVLIVDECHGTKSAVIGKLINEYGKHIPFRFGLTGTLPKPEAERMTIRCAIGVVKYTITARWLIDNGYLAQIDIETYITSDAKEEFPDYDSEKAFLYSSKKRIEIIANQIIEDAKKYGNTFVLVDSVDYGKRLEAAIPGSIFMYGQTKKKDRKAKYKEFDERNDMIVICNSQIASTGISIDRIFHLCLVDTGKSFIRAIQSIGRGLRKSKDKWKVYVKDYSSSLKYSTKHRKERLKWYKEAEYEINNVTKLK